MAKNLNFGVPESSSQPKSGSFDWMGLGLGVISTGGTIYSSEQQRKASEAQANALRAKGLSEVEVAKLMLEGKKLELEQAKLGAGATTGSKTLYIALGVGAVVILGVVIFAVTRKK
jgi:hypothetical protein